MRYTVIEPVSDIDGYFVCVDRRIIDVVSGLVTYLLERRAYASDLDYERGYNIAAQLKGCILSCPAERLINAAEATVRFLDAANYGTVYEVASIDPLVIEPPVPLLPPAERQLPGKLAQLDLANVTLTEIRDALQTEDADPEDIAALLQLIAGLLV